ncbi:hypothetical protein KW798_02865 [Candidatus Parcubacteria bacterium]|nr:hypothetical protein [Candidatus Parcubacteria bacterium]
MSNVTIKWVLACSFATAAAGFLLPFWPLSVAGILLSSLSGRWIFAISVGLLFDIAYGAPMNAPFMFFPFTLVALLGVVGRYLGAKYLFNKSLPDTL